MTRNDLIAPDDIPDGRTVGTIISVEMHEVDGVPRAIVFMSGMSKGVLLDHAHARALTEAFGPHPVVERWLAMQ